MPISSPQTHRLFYSLGPLFCSLPLQEMRIARLRRVRMRDVEHVQVEEHDHVKPVQQLEHEERTVVILEQPDQHPGGGRMLDEAPTRHPPDHLRRMLHEAPTRHPPDHHRRGTPPMAPWALC